MKKTILLTILIALFCCSAVFADGLPTIELIRRNDQDQQLIQKVIPNPDQGANMAPLNFMPQNRQQPGSAIQFAWGATSAVINGFIPAGSTVSYNLYAMQNQNMGVYISSATGTAVLGVSDVYGNVYQDVYQYRTGCNMYLPQTATYYINLYSPQPTEFTLQVYIPARIQIPYGQTVTSVSGQVGPYSVVSYTAYMNAGQLARIDDYSGAQPTSFLRVSGLNDGIIYMDYTAYMPSWYAYVPVSQDYLIEVITLDQTSNYTLTVNVQ